MLSNDGLTALHDAVRNNREDIVRVLVKDLRVDMNAEDAKGRTALVKAESHGNVRMVETLLTRQDTYAPYKRTTALCTVSSAVDNFALHGESVVLRTCIGDVLSLSSGAAVRENVSVIAADHTCLVLAVDTQLRVFIDNINCMILRVQNKVSSIAVSGEYIVVGMENGGICVFKGERMI